MRRPRWRRWLGIVFEIALIPLTVFAASTLMQSPCVGVADIQDFWRVMRPAGIDHESPLTHPGYYAQCTFVTGDADLTSAPSSSAALAWIARFATFEHSDQNTTFHLRQIGIVYLLLLGLLIVSAPSVLAFLTLYVMVDPGYLLFFNSFYADATLFVALAGTSLWLARKPPESTTALLVLPLLALLGGGSKMQYVLFPAVLLVTVMFVAIPRMAHASRGSRWRMVGLGVTLAAVSLAVAWNFFLGPGPRFLVFNNYHAVYGGILKVASDPNAVLEDLDVPRAYWDLPRTDAWSAGVGPDHPVHPHLATVSRLTLLRHYAQDLPALNRTRREIEDHLARVESHPRGTRVRDPADRGPVKRTFEVPWQFSKVTRAVLARHPSLVWWLLGATTGVLLVAAGRRRWTGMHTAELFLVAWSTSQMVIAVLGEGMINLHQHLVAARLGLDLLAVFLLVHLVRAGTRTAVRARARRDDGITVESSTTLVGIR